MVLGGKANHDAARGDAAVDQRLSFDEKTRRAFGLIDQADRGGVEDFFRFLSGKGALERDPTETLTLPRIERYLPETLNELQVEHLIESIDTKHPLGLRDRAMVELLYASGLRISELANARLENLNFDERILRVTGKGKQDAPGAGGTKGVRGGGRLSFDRAATTR